MTDGKKILVLASVVLTGGLLYLLSSVLTPFLFGALLAYLGDPLVDQLEARKIPRTFGVLIVFTIMLLVSLALLLVILPVLQQQVSAFLARIPDLMRWLQNDIVPRLLIWAGTDPSVVDSQLLLGTVKENWRDVGNFVGYILSRAGDSGQILLAWLTYLVLVPVVTFYLLRDWDLLVGHIRDLLPRPVEPTVTRLVSDCDAVLAEFLRGQLLVMFALAAIYAIGLWLAGLEFSLLIGALAGLVSFVPYLGGIVGIGVASVAAYVQYHDLTHLLYVALVFAIGQGVEGMILSPWLVGDRIGLHPVAVIFAVMAGGQLFGFFGILLALPAAAVITVLLRFAHQHYLDSEFYTP